jgi:hypothetical protein
VLADRSGHAKQHTERDAHHGAQAEQPQADTDAGSQLGGDGLAPDGGTEVTVHHAAQPSREPERDGFVQAQFRALGFDHRWGRWGVAALQLRQRGEGQRPQRERQERCG